MITILRSIISRKQDTSNVHRMKYNGLNKPYIREIITYIQDL